MEIIVDPDVRAVAEFMQEKIEARKLVGVAEALRAISSILWGHYDGDPVVGMTLVPGSIMCASQPAAIESHPERTCVGDGSAAAD